MVTSWIEFSYIIDFTIMQKDQAPMSRRVSMVVIDTTDRTAKERLDEYNRALSVRAERSRASLPLWKRVFPVQNGRVVHHFIALKFAGELKPFMGIPELLELTGSFETAQGVRFPDLLWVPAWGIGSQPSSHSNQPKAKDA